MAVHNGAPSLVQRPSTNALSSKVTGVLSASYADADIRHALALLDERKVESNAETRRQLRLEVQRDVIESNGAIIREFGHVAEQLRRIGQSIASLNQGCAEMREHINAAQMETRPMMDEAAELMSQRENVEIKQQLLQAFNTHFIISEDDIAALTSSAEPLSDRFFAVLSRAKKIQVDCEVLLGTENQRLGQEIMDQTTKNIGAAFQKLHRWVQKEFKSINLENPQISSSIRRALRVLAERPSLFQSCLDSFAEAREHVLSDSFYTALTGSTMEGREDKSVKPIELAAHDPLRYVGDMLAWTHSATVSEREALEVLFISEGDEIAKGIQAGRENEPWNKYAGDEEETSEFDGAKALKELVDRDVAGVAQVLRQRIGQVVQSHEETIMAYKIANLLNFYRTTFSKLLGPDSVLLEALVTLEESSLRQFRSLVRDHIAGIQSEPQQVPKDLGPPEFLQEGLKQLTAVMKTYDTSFSTAMSREGGFTPILTEAFEPFMQQIKDMATKDLKSPSSTIFTVNCLLAANTVLSVFDFTITTTSSLQAEIQESADSLVGHQYDFLLHSSGLESLILSLRTTTTLEKADEKKTDISQLVAFNPKSLAAASQTLDNFLPSALMDAMENLRHVQSSKLAREVTEEAAERFCRDFELLEESILAADEDALLKGREDGEDRERNGAVDEAEEDEVGNGGLRALFPRTSGEIRVLLS